MPSPPTHSGCLWKLVCYSLDRKLYPFENEHDRRCSLNNVKLLSSQNSNCINKSVVNGAKRQQPLTLPLLGEQLTPAPPQEDNYSFPFAPPFNNECGRLQWENTDWLWFFFHSLPRLSSSAPYFSVNVDFWKLPLSFSRRTWRVTFWSTIIGLMNLNLHKLITAPVQSILALSILSYFEGIRQCFLILFSP